jgi:fluoroacetyl-CoA thioesterase
MSPVAKSPRPEAILRRTVTASDTAAGFGPDFPEAASTPFVLGLAEVASHEVVRESLAPGDITVGVRAEIKHLAPSPVGAELTARSKLVVRRGRRLFFHIEVLDGNEIVARIRHQRAVVNAAHMRERLGAR